MASPAPPRDSFSCRGGDELDVPALLALLAKIEFGRDGDACGGTQREVGRDGRLLVLGKFQQRALHRDFIGENFREHRQRVDAGIEHAETARLPDPALPGVPVVHVFFPGDLARHQLAACAAIRARHRPRLRIASASSETACVAGVRPPRPAARSAAWSRWAAFPASRGSRRAEPSTPPRNAPGAACRWKRIAGRACRRAWIRDP